MNHPVPAALATPEAIKRHAKCSDCARCGSRLHCSHQCGNYRIFKRG